jgi:hypothetical protein
MTQAEIQLLIDQIVTGANYRANQLNPLLTDMLTASYGPMFIDNVPPDNSNDETEGYRLGSIGYDTLSQRFYICKDASAGAADWVLIPADANYEWKSYAAAGESINLSQNTSVFKAYNTDTVTNVNCYVNLPANPYTGKVVILYFENEMNTFTINDNSGTPIFSDTIPLGQQYTITYGGVAWEIVGVSNINPATVTGIAVSKVGGVNVADALSINFSGTAVTVTSGAGRAANVAINPISGIDVQRNGSVRKADAQFINFAPTFFDVDANGDGADISFVQKIVVTKDTAARSTTATGFDFGGPLFDTVSMVGTIATVTMNGAKTLTLAGANAPAVTDDGSAGAGYSRGSVAVNTGTLLRTYICTDNTIGAAQWRRVTEDNGYVTAGITNNGSLGAAANISSVLLTGTGSIGLYGFSLPPLAYTGKKVFVSFKNTSATTNLVIGTMQVFANASVIENIPSLTIAPNSYKLIMYVCTNEATQTWVRMQ